MISILQDKTFDDHDKRVKLAKELIRTAAECVKMLQKEQKVVPPPGMVKKYLIDLGILEEYHKTQEEKDRERIQGKWR